MDDAPPQACPGQRDAAADYRRAAYAPHNELVLLLEFPMRARRISLVLAAAAAAVITRLNWAEFSRSSSLNLVWSMVNVPLALVLLGLLALAVVVSMASGTALRARQRRQERDHAEALKTQRDLADRAEPSSLIDLRQALDAHVRDSRERESGLSTSLEQVLQRQHRETRTQLEGQHRALVTRLGELEARLESRLDGMLASRRDWSSNGPAAAATQETGHAASWAEPVETAEAQAEAREERRTEARHPGTDAPTRELPRQVRRQPLT